MPEEAPFAYRSTNPSLAARFGPLAVRFDEASYESDSRITESWRDPFLTLPRIGEPQVCCPLPPLPRRLVFIVRSGSDLA